MRLAPSFASLLQYAILRGCHALLDLCSSSLPHNSLNTSEVQVKLHERTEKEPLRRYQRRWLVERFFSWLQWKSRLLVLWEYYATNFLGFVQLASIIMLLK